MTVVSYKVLSYSRPSAHYPIVLSIEMTLDGHRQDLTMATSATPIADALNRPSLSAVATIARWTRSNINLAME
jgi:hypothetical protein